MQKQHNQPKFQYILNQWVYLHVHLQQIVGQLTIILHLIPKCTMTEKNSNMINSLPLTSGYWTPPPQTPFPIFNVHRPYKKSQNLHNTVNLSLLTHRSECRVKLKTQQQQCSNLHLIAP